MPCSKKRTVLVQQRGLATVGRVGQAAELAGHDLVPLRILGAAVEPWRAVDEPIHHVQGVREFVQHQVAAARHASTAGHGVSP